MRLPAEADLVGDVRDAEPAFDQQVLGLFNAALDDEAMRRSTESHDELPAKTERQTPAWTARSCRLSFSARRQLICWSTASKSGPEFRDGGSCPISRTCSASRRSTMCAIWQCRTRSDHLKE